jgi:hypothetical protein
MNRYFESAWEMVRPVPVVRIDFGNNTVVTRTLHGNIATYVCNADGEVLDILPGIYTSKAYLDCLNQFRLLANYVAQPGEANRGDRLRAYHQNQADKLSKNLPPDVFINTAGVTKARIERTVAKLVSAKEVSQVPVRETPHTTVRDELFLNSPEELTNWHLLVEDTRINETIRRRQIHELLAAAGPVRPGAVVKRIYKDVLHTDLDDPYLGLGKVLFAGYPFAREDQGR